MSRWSLGASFCLHLIAFWFLLGATRRVDHTAAHKELVKKALAVRSISEKEFSTEIDAQKKLLQETGQVVQTDAQLRDEKAPDDTNQRKFLSEFNQRVDRNTRAPRIGEFKNVLEEGLDEGEEQVKKVVGEKPLPNNKAQGTKRGLAAVQADPNRLFALADLGANVQSDDSPVRAPSSILSNSKDIEARRGKGLSATDDFLDGVAVGANTMLNAQEFTYFSFYDRIRKRLVERWRSRIRKEIARLPASTGNPLSVGSKITRIEVRMDMNGDLIGIDKVGLSGVESFDETAVVSFREAAPFPHPPTQMLKEGVVTIRWDFVVLVEQASMVKFGVERAQ